MGLSWRRRRKRAHLLNGVFVLLFVVSFIAYVTIQVATDDLLDPRFYSDALEENRIYERVYSELLSDPELRDVTTQLLGRMSLDPTASEYAYSQTVSALRLVLPPDVLREAITTVILELTAYLSGSRHQLRAHINLSEALDDPDLEQKIIAGIQLIVTALLTQVTNTGPFPAMDNPPPNVADLYAELRGFGRALANGQIETLPPEIITFPIEQLTDTQKRELTRILLDPVARYVSVESREQIETALLNNDLSSAIVIASGELAALRVEDAVEALNEQLQYGRLRGVRTLAELSDRRTNEVIDELNDVRNLVQLARDDLSPGVLALMIVSLVGMVVVHAGSIHSLLRSVGIALLLAGVLTPIIWTVIASQITLPYESMIGIGPLPHTLSQMFNDVLESLRLRLRVTVWSRAAVPLTIGAGLFGVSYMPAAWGLMWLLVQKRTLHPYAALAGVVMTCILIPVTIDWVTNLNQVTRASAMRCNGHTELCRRRLDEVVFPATHNAMASSSLGWLWPHQDGDLSVQLEAGVRALLIDVHYGDTNEEIAGYLETFPTSTRAIMRRVIAAADDSLRGDGLFLCHNLCSLGGTPLESALGDIRAFLDRYPNEVVILIIQDEAATGDIVQAFEASGLAQYAYAQPPGEKWPTLGEMIERNKRLVVFGERGGSPPEWYMHFWDYAQETNYSYKSSTAFDCAPNRGNPDGSLFLLNHWVARRAPDRADARFVNSYRFMLGRAEICTDERGLKPNVVAVDFFSIGDLFKVVEKLNGLRE